VTVKEDTLKHGVDGITPRINNATVPARSFESSLRIR